MSALPLRPVPVPRETLPSFVSRMAAKNFTSVMEFAQDMGFTFRAVLLLDPAVLDSIARLGGLDDDRMADLVSWTGTAIGDVRTTFRSEVFVSRALRNPQVRGCPICLREDADAHDGRAVEAMAMRGHWQLRHAMTCVAHDHPLIPLWQRGPVPERFDTVARLAEIEGDIRSGALDRRRRTPTAYDLWLDARLATGDDGTWLAGHPLYAGTTFCHLLGQALLRLGDHVDTEETEAQWIAHDLGFQVARGGETAIANALAHLAANTDHYNDLPNKTFKPLYHRLSTDLRDDPDFAPFRALMRDRILATWPMAAGDDVLGERLEVRRLHSLRSAAREIGVGSQFLEQFLVRHGAIAPDDDRPDTRKTFDAAAYADLLAEIPTLVGPKEMRRAISATLPQFRALVDAGLLVPRIDISTVKFPWRLSDGARLLDLLRAGATRIDPADRDWEHINRARIRTGVDLRRIVEAIEEKRLRVGHRPDLAGYAGIFVCRNDVDVLKDHRSRRQRPEFPSAGEFGRSIGLRNRADFQRLVDDGHTPGTPLPNPRTHRVHVYITEEDAAAFHAKFMTISTIIRETGLHRNSANSLIEKRGVERFRPAGEDYGPVYLRADVERALSLRP
ncbi:TniQ protein [Palleronia aestuarii]|uniref:TniQ protein n=2 Tax=Palleronia aestuarii TaxID=568105 RepID=A0A2W7PTP6_9RHOB|nr:TniQ protein [Palleronia aestuarii]PZX12829.1 TniQ protein [Palleronia aestuarii]PZX15717.1 TniQ protein [Palleronia aestuarii]